MKVAIGCDHAGYAYKEAIKKHLKDRNIELVDMGTNGPDSVDYPDFVHPVASSVSESESDFGILICGSGNGVAMTANKYAKIRCGLCWEPELAELTKKHNNANVVAIPARFIDIDKAIEIVDAFFDSFFEGGRHQRRVDKIIPEVGYMC